MTNVKAILFYKKQYYTIAHLQVMKIKKEEEHLPLSSRGTRDPELAYNLFPGTTGVR
jgi:hypothetical protein